jgi:hypothetical protein
LGTKRAIENDETPKVTALLKLNALLLIFVGAACLIPVISAGPPPGHRQFGNWIIVIILCLASMPIGACALIWASKPALSILSRKWGYIWILSLWSWILAVVIIWTNYLYPFEGLGPFMGMVYKLSLTQVIILFGLSCMAIAGYVCNLVSVTVITAAGFIERRSRKIRLLIEETNINRQEL